MQPDRLKKLARHLDALALRDGDRLRREAEIHATRRDAAARLHATCATLVRDVNEAISAVKLDMAPTEFPVNGFQGAGSTIFQIHVSGRVIQIMFQGTEPLVSTENLRIPYTIEGSIRWFNQEMLDHDEIKDHRLYFTVERGGNQWRFYDPSTHRSGVVDEEYLAGLLEQLV